MHTYELQSDFHTEVLDASETLPVLVDFWAAWCGPCRILGPILETLATENTETWKLVKIDTEAHPHIAGQFEIRAIPTVMLFHQGAPIAEFQGALPEAQIRDWLSQNLPGKMSSERDTALAALAAGDAETAKKLLIRVLAGDPEDLAAKGLLARAHVFDGDLETAAGLAGEVPEEEPEHDAAAAILFLNELLSRSRNLATSDSADPDLRRFLEGIEFVPKRGFREALETWLEVLMRNRTLEDDGARKAIIALFQVLGPEHPLTQEYRRKLASALY